MSLEQDVQGLVRYLYEHAAELRRYAGECCDWDNLVSIVRMEGRAQGLREAAQRLECVIVQNRGKERD